MEQFLWTELYRPKSVKDTILPDNMKSVFQSFVDKKEVPNMILSGTSGVGKTSVAKAVLTELECEYLVINGSLNGNIDTLRNEIHNFASTVSLYGGKKYIILDEADYLNANSTQPALRNFMEEFSKNCGFILTCNFKNRIIQPLHSRCTVIDFNFNKNDKVKLAMCFMKRIEMILKNEGIEYERSVIAEIIQKYFPDFRRVLNELQRYSSSGKIDTGILVDVKETSITELISILKQKNYPMLRNWLYNNSDCDMNELYRQFYDYGSEYFTKQTLPHLIILLGKYQYQNAFVADAEINFMAFLVEVMVECEILDK